MARKSTIPYDTNNLKTLAKIITNKTNVARKIFLDETNLH